MEHVLAKYEYQPKSYPPYRHYAECSCGFSTRLATKEAALSQLENHIMSKGIEPSSTSDDTVKEEIKKDGWNPFAGGEQQKKTEVTPPEKPRIKPLSQ